MNNLRQEKVRLRREPEAHQPQAEMRLWRRNRRKEEAKGTQIFLSPASYLLSPISQRSILCCIII